MQPVVAKTRREMMTMRKTDLVDSDDEKLLCRQGAHKLEISDKVQGSQHSSPLCTNSSASCSEVASSPQVDSATPVDIQANTTHQFVDDSERAQWAQPVARQMPQEKSKWKVEEQPHQHDQTRGYATVARERYAKGAARNTGRGHTESTDKSAAKAAGKGGGKSGACARSFGAKGASKSGGWHCHSSTKGHGKAPNEKLQCQFVIGIEEDTKFRVVKRIIGRGGENMKNVAQRTDAKLRLRGRGSKFLEGLEQKESTDELMLCISSQDKFGFESAKELVSELLEGIYESYRLFCAKSGHRSPSLSIRFHEGYREGSR